MSDDSSKKETLASRAQTVINDETSPAEDAITVAELPSELFAGLHDKKNNVRPNSRLTDPIEQSLNANETLSLSDSNVPILSDKLIESIRRANSAARYVNDYIKEIKTLGIAHLQQAYPYSFLVGIGLVGEIDGTARSSREQRTREVLISDIQDIVSQSPVLASRVWALKGTPNVTGRPGITVGRSARNDVVITEFALSTVHCRFTQDSESKQFSITDLNSTNGTLLNGKKLIPNEKILVNDRDTIILGRYKFKYFSNAGFGRFLSKRAAGLTA